MIVSARRAPRGDTRGRRARWSAAGASFALLVAVASPSAAYVAPAWSVGAASYLRTNGDPECHMQWLIAANYKIHVSNLRPTDRVYWDHRDYLYAGGSSCRWTPWQSRGYFTTAASGVATLYPQELHQYLEQSRYRIVRNGQTIQTRYVYVSPTTNRVVIVD